VAKRPKYVQGQMEQLHRRGLHHSRFYPCWLGLFLLSSPISTRSGKQLSRTTWYHRLLFTNAALQYCLVYEDNFKTIDPNVWSYEVQLDGFGTGSFDWTTTDSKNSYVDAEGLHIVPTLTNETTSITSDQLYSGHTLDLSHETGDGTCTGQKTSSCTISSDPKKGSMIPPIRSARMSTKGKKGIRYGRVEVVAKLPVGNWIWPAICM
jgi:beta-glucanase (GH16 family)